MTKTTRVVVTRAGMVRSFLIAPVIGLIASRAAKAQVSKPHRVVFHVDQNDAAIMGLALNNARNVIDYYRDKNEDVEAEIVAYGLGLHMFREDTSPVKDRIRELADASFPSKVVFTGCNNTKQAMEAREGHPIQIVAQAGMVPAAVVRIMELQEQGYSYIKP